VAICARRAFAQPAELLTENIRIVNPIIPLCEFGRSNGSAFCSDAGKTARSMTRRFMEVFLARALAPTAIRLLNFSGKLALDSANFLFRPFDRQTQMSNNQGGSILNSKVNRAEARCRTDGQT
jgi:hypothetical protein